MIADSGRSVAFTGHRTYDGTAAESLSAAVERLYGRGFRTFLSGMAVGFDLAAAEAVLTLRAAHPDVRLVAVVPFRGQEERFSPADRVRFRRAVAAADEVEVLAGGYRRGCYAVRNDFLVSGRARRGMVRRFAGRHALHPAPGLGPRPRGVESSPFGRRPCDPPRAAGAVLSVRGGSGAGKKIPGRSRKDPPGVR